MLVGDVGLVGAVAGGVARAGGFGIINNRFFSDHND